MKLFFLAVALFGLCPAYDQSIAQQLIIESPQQGPVVRVIYGQITATNLIIYENKIPFESLAHFENTQKNQNLVPPDNGPDGSIEPPSASNSGVAITSFTLSRAEIKMCVLHPRYKGLRDLSQALNTKIKSIVISSSSEGEACAAEIAKSLATVLKDAQWSRGNSDVEGVKVQLNLSKTFATKPILAQSDEVVSPVVEEVENFEETLKNTKINIGDQQVKPNADGFFVAEFTSLNEVDLETSIPRRKSVQVKIRPILLSGTPFAVTNGEGYSRVVAEFSKQTLKVVIRETIFLAKTTTIDGGFGGGIGYGRQVPGERKGQRTVTLIGLERREIFDLVGARVGAFYTRSTKTVVPQTITLRGSGFYDYKFFDDALIVRLGGGMELFMAKIKNLKSGKAADPNKPQVLIPEQVSAPLVSLNIYSVLFDWAIVSASLIVTPLYVPTVGFYPSINPSMEVGTKINKKWLLVAQAGSETHRFPSVYGETKLQFDYTSLSLRLGL